MQRRSAAYEAGLRPGDIIIAFNGQPVTTPADLYRHIADAKIGTTGTLKILRERRTIEIRVPITAEAAAEPQRGHNAFSSEVTEPMKPQFRRWQWTFPREYVISPLMSQSLRRHLATSLFGALGWRCSSCRFCRRAPARPGARKKLLFLTHPSLYKHPSLGPAEAAVAEWGNTGGFDVTTLEGYKQDINKIDLTS